jgi:benzodiazapine receptor
VRVFQNSEEPYRRDSPNRILALLGFVGLCLLVGVTAATVTASSVHSWYPTLARPPGTPPNWVFAPVWTTLYVMMAVSAWLVWGNDHPARYRVLRLWGWQLLLNALWTPAFFGLRSTGLGLAIILPLPVLIALTAFRFAPLNRLAAALLVPYLLWSAYAAYLTTGFFILNAL